jgi:hypothetical protein
VPNGVEDWEVTVSVELPDPPAIEALERETVGPVAGEMVAARFTVPVKPFSEATVIEEVPVAPGIMESEVGLAPSVKSGTPARPT